jgi:hypothetical protein
MSSRCATPSAIGYWPRRFRTLFFAFGGSAFTPSTFALISPFTRSAVTPSAIAAFAFASAAFLSESCSGFSQILDELVAEALNAFNIIPTLEWPIFDQPARSLSADSADFR